MTCDQPAAGPGHTSDDLRWYQCDDVLEPMPYPETVVAFEAPAAGIYRFWLGGDGPAVHELVLLVGVCSSTACDSVGPEAVWILAEGERVFLAVEGPPTAGWKLHAECPLPPPPGTCAATAEFACGEQVTVPAGRGGPADYGCPGAEAQLGPEAIAVFRAAEAGTVTFEVSAVEGPPMARRSVPTWPALVVAGQGDSCEPATCLAFDYKPTVALEAGQAVFVIADGDLGEEVVSATISAHCQ